MVNLSPMRFSDFFSFDSNKITCGHQYKLSKKCFGINIRKYSFSVRVVNLWNRFPRIVRASCGFSVLKSFK